MRWLLILVTAIAIILIATGFKTVERYHPAWCQAVYIWKGQIIFIGLPCKYRTNTPRDV